MFDSNTTKVLTWDEWLKLKEPEYNYDTDTEKSGVAKANKRFAKLWARYERYLNTVNEEA